MIGNISCSGGGGSVSATAHTTIHVCVCVKKRERCLCVDSKTHFIRLTSQIWQELSARIYLPAARIRIRTGLNLNAKKHTRKNTHTPTHYNTHTQTHTYICTHTDVRWEMLERKELSISTHYCMCTLQSILNYVSTCCTAEAPWSCEHVNSRGAKETDEVRELQQSAIRQKRLEHEVAQLWAANVQLKRTHDDAGGYSGARAQRRRSVSPPPFKPSRAHSSRNCVCEVGQLCRKCRG